MLKFEYISKNNLAEFDIKNIIDKRVYKDRYPAQHGKRSNIAFTYQLLKYASVNFVVHYKISYGYTYSKSVIDHYHEFNNTLVEPFLNYISTYLEELLIDMEDNQSKFFPSITNNGIFSINNARTINITDNSIVYSNLSEVLDLIDFVLMAQLNEIETQIKDELAEYLEI